MDSIFKITKSGVYGILVEGLEKDNGEYLDETTDVIVSTRNYAFSHSVTINALTSIKADGTETFVSSDIVEHVVDCIDNSEFVFTIDGLYKVSHIILPTQVWLAYVKSKDATALQAYNLIYYYNTTDGKYYKYIDDTHISEVTLTEILAINAVAPVLITDKTSTIIRTDKNTFSTCFLTDCFNNVCKNLLTTLPTTCKNKVDDLQSLIFTRDLLWMSINVIKYCLDLQQLYEAQRYLEGVTYCNTCPDYLSKTNSNSTGCGCNN